MMTGSLMLLSPIAMPVKLSLTGCGSIGWTNCSVNVDVSVVWVLVSVDVSLGLFLLTLLFNG